MNVGIVVSVSEAIADVVAMTTPNKLEYAMRHGYSLVLDNQPYADAVRTMTRVCTYLDRFDLVWTLDADAIVTNMGVRLEQLECLGPNATVCEEGIVPWNRLNCGSVIWRNTANTRELLRGIDAAEPVWRSLPCMWQTWLEAVAKQKPEYLTVAPLRAFNSCAWNRPGGVEGTAGSHWHRGDFVFHPCGVFPMAERLQAIEERLEQVVR